MNIAYVTMQFPKPSETFLTREITSLTKLGVNISVYTLRRRHQEADRLQADRGIIDTPVFDDVTKSTWASIRWCFTHPVKLLSCTAWVIKSNILSPIDLLKSILLMFRAFAIYDMLTKRDYDIVHIYWAHFPSIVGWLLKEFSPDTTITSFIGAYDMEKRYGGTAEVLRSAARVFTLAQANVAPIREWFGVDESKMRVFYHSLDLSKISDVVTGVRKEPKRIVSAGRLVRAKRMDDVIRVFGSVLDEYEDATLIIMGDGPDRSRLEYLCSELGLDERVQFLGHVPEERVFEEMARGDVFLFLSDKSGERLPNVIKEAMLCQCLCVSSHTPGIEELIEDGKDGYLVAPGDLSEASRIIIQYLSDPGSYQHIRNSAVEKIKSRFSLSEYAERYKKEWSLVLDRSNKKV